MNFSSLQTPCVLVDQARVERNVERMQAAATAHGKRLRPHAKTHKSPDFAALQVARGAVGICCAKLGEAEVFAARGVRDIRLPYPLNPAVGGRLVPLLERTHLSFIVDDLEVARGWSAVLQGAGVEADVLVKVDVGFHRCGIDPGAGAAEMVEQVAGLPGLRFRGLLSHAGQAYAASSADQIRAIAEDEARELLDLRDRVTGRGVPVEEISVGATPTARYSVQLEGITEVRPGNYIYFDRMQVGLGSAAWNDCALTVLARVVSRPAADRLVLDSGSKTLTSDLARGLGAAAGYGAVLRSLMATEVDTDLLVERLSEEHAVVRVQNGTSALRPGDLVRIVPNHSCVVSNLVDEVWLVDGDRVVDRLDIAARGRIT